MTPHASPDDIWGWAARQAAAHSTHQPEPDFDTLSRQVDGIVERFLREVQERHGASIDALLRMPRPTGDTTRCLGDTQVLIVIEISGQYKFRTQVGSADFCMWPDGRWGYFIDPGDDYVPPTCMFGYGDGGEFCAEPQAFRSINVASGLLATTTAQTLAQCVYAEW